MFFMLISAFDLFRIGIGPSSSHTVGPMRAAYAFVQQLEKLASWDATQRITVDLYGSLALTGHGHSTDIAVMLGLMGATPDTIDPESVSALIADIRSCGFLNLFNKKIIPFVEKDNLLFHMDKALPLHPNAMRFTAYDAEGKELCSILYYSVGGGFIVEHSVLAAQATSSVAAPESSSPCLPYPFETAQQLLDHATSHNMTIDQIMMENEKLWRSEEQIRSGLLNIWAVMRRCMERGCQQQGVLPGGLGVKRRAHPLWLQLCQRKNQGIVKPTDIMEWVSLWALAVNEENAAGSRVVTAPTNGAAGVIPAVLRYYEEMTDNPSPEGIVTFMLVAAAIGILYKKGASISAAEMGCMGEVGVACSMAAGGLTAALGGSNQQIENAAEIGMEHNLGLTCDPIKGLVQIPCIERNTMGAIKAINATMLSLNGDGTHHVSLDQVIATMRQTGHDMQTIYKETSLGGLAIFGGLGVNMPEC